METKVWYRSKTFWWNALTIAGLLGSFLIDPKNGLDQVLDPQMLLGLNAAGNILLRFVSAAQVVLFRE